MGFVTEKDTIRQPAILSLVQHDNDFVELLVKPDLDHIGHSLGFFRDGALELCVRHVSVLRDMGIKYTLSGATGGRILIRNVGMIHRMP